MTTKALVSQQSGDLTTTDIMAGVDSATLAVIHESLDRNKGNTFKRLTDLETKGAVVSWDSPGRLAVATGVDGAAKEPPRLGRLLNIAVAGAYD